MMTQEMLPRVAIPSMNDTHLEEVILVNSISRALKHREPEEVGRLLDELIAHTATHFDEEEMMMLRTGFPPYPMHKEEHDRALRKMRHLAAAWKKAPDYAAMSDYIEHALPEWMVQHIETMDTVTANFVAEHDKAPSS